MKQSKRIAALALGLTAFAAAIVASVDEFLCSVNTNDLELRVNEIRCSSEGVNPLDVFTGKIPHEKYYSIIAGEERWGLERNPSATAAVHAYPPWHTTYFYWYNSLPPEKVFRIMMFVYGLAFAGMFAYAAAVFKRNLPEYESLRPAVWGIFSVLVAPIAILTIYTCNYSVMIAGIMALMMLALEKKHDVLAGVCWALAMIKPQIAVLFFWPLLFSKRYVAICTAIAICILATLFPAWLYGQSPLELILQIPEIGKPFCDMFIDTWCHNLAKRIFGVEAGVTIVTALMFGLGGVLSWLFRNAGEWWLRFVPVAAIMPYWTYMLGYDRICTWPLAILVVIVALGSGAFNFAPRTRKYLFAAAFAYMATILAYQLWLFANKLGWQVVHGKGVLYYVSQLFKWFFFAVAAWSMFRPQSANVGGTVES